MYQHSGQQNGEYQLLFGKQENVGSYISWHDLVTANVCITCHEAFSFKVGTSGYGNLQTMNTDKWATSKSTQLSTKIWVKLLLLLENALKLNSEAL